MASDPALRDGRRRWAVVFAIALACVLPVFLMLANQYLDGRENVVTQCLAAANGAPPGVSVSEAPAVTAQITAWPAGRRCVWRLDDGGLVSFQSGWPTTILGLTFSAVIAALTLVLFRVRRSATHLVLSLLPVALTTLIWLLVFAMSGPVVGSLGP